ncbi:MAG TPA: hypothetical protein VMJ35_10355 [Dongiaceae bacterium]|nr:hypothetical protein [Dongiaceae bacterium]
MSFLVNHPVLFFVVSLVALWLAAHSGAFLRQKLHPDALDDDDDYSLVLGATLTLLGLLIGFTFSMAAGRYDQRKNYEEEEANAIGTEYVRADLLPPADAEKVRVLLREYLDLRIVYYSHLSHEQLQQNDAATAQLQSRLWTAITPAVNAEPNPVRALVTSGMNDVLNRQGYTQAAWLNRVPVAAWLLMIAIAIFSNVLFGFRAKGKKSKFMFLYLPIALSISFFLVSDIDAPRGGVILVHPQNLQILADSMRPH